MTPLPEVEERKAASRHPLKVLAILSALMAFASISTDVYLPALPAMACGLHSTAGAMELTVSSYLIGFSLGHLLWGPIGDRYGRRLPVAAGLVLFVIGSVGCALAPSPAAIIVWRVVQAVGGCAGVVLARAMVKDLYEGNRAAQMLSTLMTVTAIAPLVGPLLGGQILVVASWRAIFWVLAGTGLLTLTALFALPETLAPERRNTAPLGRAVLGYFPLLRRRRFLGYAGASGFFYSGIYAYVAGSPFAYITYHHLKPQLYGVLFGVGIVGIMASNLLNARWVMRLGGLTLMRGGTAGAALASVALGIDSRTGFGGLAGLAVPLFVYIGLAGFILANAIMGAMALAPERAGMVSALVGAVQYGSGIVGSAALSAFSDGTPWTMGWVIALSGLGSAVCAWVLVRAPSREYASKVAAR